VNLRKDHYHTSKPKQKNKGSVLIVRERGRCDIIVVSFSPFPSMREEFLAFREQTEIEWLLLMEMFVFPSRSHSQGIYPLQGDDTMTLSFFERGFSPTSTIFSLFTE